jgi:hypothetical protein
MKKTVMAAAAILTTALASSAFAQSYQPSVGSGNIVGPLNARNSGPTIPGYRYDGTLAGGQNAGYGAYAYAPPLRVHHHRYWR